MKLKLDNEDHVNVIEAARRIGVSDETIRRWIRLGRLPAEKLGLQYFIPEKEVERLVRQRPDSSA